MNKQEALEEILAECRNYETPEGMRSAPARRKAEQGLISEIEYAVGQLREGDVEATDSLVRAGGMILALLVDEEG